jgi:murein DD-endopeptidase MepM/ murein hydrolase activator NlpD
MQKYLLLILILLNSVLTKCVAQFNTVSAFGTVKTLPSKKQFEVILVPDSTIKDVSATEPIPFISDNLKIRFSYPVASQIHYSSKFGMRMHPELKQLKLHAGVDICAYYEPVLSIAEGIVKTVAWGEREGIYIVITHGDFESVYAHLSRIFVQQGQLVSAAEKIGVSGNTGMSSGVHLHFGMKYKGRFFNPRIFLDNLRTLRLKGNLIFYRPLGSIFFNK